MEEREVPKPDNAHTDTVHLPGDKEHDSEVSGKLKAILRIMDENKEVLRRLADS